ncbi:MAG TPA: flagellar M-ring protein FliF [Hungateiclostridium thermocellum]|uniref:Flagellar M-ring protein FliF n=1 Tax=Acetivibrio thermocellus (strain ATCC 27405 / DSM 1237 / JCM 9322 / NBRC 103400 / NCIMB 10682 / NRRL B-4536 / VPI 7372) TaxID=203119 RepID=A3DCM4_ACET2|nr:flagellar M-ring protein FliF C-terminal domain-containing protein [Acetivibrio thermocellus]ABN51703.1 flagellar M-ring protein FliF [Acetivibrio thermocellus ATCC 27405]HBW27015.1 flagellar M-ring protein FliF [Acetivibrio thermocellus]
MPEVLSKMQQQVTDFWKNLDKSQKTRILVTSGILVVVLTIAIVMLTRTTYVPLITVQDPDSISAIEEALKERNIKYKHGEGRRILVDSKDKNEAEFALASAGLTEPGMTFEDAWSLLKVSSSESDKKQLWQNFKKNSLIAKLKMFDNVKDADIELTIPEDTMFFTDSKSEAKAAVRITPKGELTPEQVEGIVMVVASSIEGLDPKNVTVVDNNFNILNQDLSDGMNIPSSHYKLKLRIKEELEKNIKNLYSGRSDSYDFISVAVNPVLDLDKVTKNRKEIEKPTGLDEAVVSEERKTEELINGNQGGAPGMDANPGTGDVPTYPIDAGQNSSYESKSEIINRIFTETLTAEEKAIGTMNFQESSMTVALWYGNRVPDDSKLTDEFIEEFKQGLSNATGIPVGKITVNKQKLAPQEEEIVPMSERIKQFIDDYGFFALLIILIIALMLSVMPRKKKSPQLAPELATAGGPNVDEAEEELPPINFEEHSEIKKQIENFVKQKPESVAQLLRNWLSEDWD